MATYPRALLLSYRFDEHSHDMPATGYTQITSEITSQETRANDDARSHSTAICLSLRHRNESETIAGKSNECDNEHDDDNVVLFRPTFLSLADGRF